MDKLTGHLAYVCIQEPQKCFEAEKGKEYKVTVIVDEDTADAWDAIAGKQGSKSYKTAEFEKTFNFEPPYPEAKKQYAITLRRNTKLSNGEELPEKYRPRVFEKTKNGNLDVTMTKLVANGSQGTISIDVWEGPKGNVYRLKNLLVTDLIEYEKSEGANYQPGDEFGSSSVSSTDEPAKQSKSVAKKTATKPAKTSTEEDDIPF